MTIAVAVVLYENVASLASLFLQFHIPYIFVVLKAIRHVDVH